MRCGLCGRTMTSMFQHYLAEHPFYAAVTWRCCIPRWLREHPRVREQRRRRGWD